VTPPGDLRSRAVLVTGASRGIGRAVAQAFASQGDRVAVHYRDSAGLAQEVLAGLPGAGHTVVRADLADAEAVRQMVDQAAADLGGLDVVVNNAGIYETASLLDSTDDYFERAFATNVRSAFLTARAAARVLPSGGRIINIGSILGERVALPKVGIYSATKFAINGFTRAWARDLGPRGITVNAVQPGPIDTDMNPADGQFSATLKGFMALPRYGSADEIAAMVAYLAGPEAGFVTGASLTIDGGFTA